MDVTVLSWSKDGLLLSGSYDRNAYVWSQSEEKCKEGKWTAQLIILDDNGKGIICGEWASTVNKICISNASKLVMVGWWNEELNLWQLNLLGKKFSSSVISESFHPSGRVVGLGTCNNHFTLVSSYAINNEGIEDDKYSGPFKEIKTYGEMLYILD